MNFNHFLLCHKASNNPDSDIARLQGTDIYKELAKELVRYTNLSFAKYLILDLLQNTDNYKVLVNTLP